MIRYLIFLLIILVVSSFCSCQKRTQSFIASVIFDTSKAKQILDQCSRPSPKNISKIFKLEGAEVKILENNLAKLTTLDTSLNLSKYGVQYIGVVMNNKDYIYINAFPFEWSQNSQRDFPNWKVEPINMCDGGNHFFGVLFNIKQQEFSELYFDGTKVSN